MEKCSIFTSREMQPEQDFLGETQNNIQRKQLSIFVHQSFYEKFAQHKQVTGFLFFKDGTNWTWTIMFLNIFLVLVVVFSIISKPAHLFLIKVTVLTLCSDFQMVVGKISKPSITAHEATFHNTAAVFFNYFKTILCACVLFIGIFSVQAWEYFSFSFFL